MRSLAAAILIFLCAGGGAFAAPYPGLDPPAQCPDHGLDPAAQCTADADPHRGQASADAELARLAVDPPFSPIAIETPAGTDALGPSSPVPRRIALDPLDASDARSVPGPHPVAASTPAVRAIVPIGSTAKPIVTLGEETVGNGRWSSQSLIEVLALLGATWEDAWNNPFEGSNDVVPTEKKLPSAPFEGFSKVKEAAQRVYGVAMLLAFGAFETIEGGSSRNPFSPLATKVDSVGDLDVDVSGAKANAGTEELPGSDVPVDTESNVALPLDFSEAGVQIRGRWNGAEASIPLSWNEEMSLQETQAETLAAHVSAVDEKVGETTQPHRQGLVETAAAAGTKTETFIASTSADGLSVDAFAPSLATETLPSIAPWIAAAVTGALTALLLYSRLSRAALDEQRMRAAILESVRATPGQRASDIAGRLGIHHTTARYHLDRMHKSGIVVARVSGRRMHYFVSGDPRTASVDAFASTSSSAARRIREAVSASPGIRVADACAAVGMGREQVHYHVRKLVAAGVLRVERQAMGFRLFPA